MIRFDRVNHSSSLNEAGFGEVAMRSLDVITALMAREVKTRYGGYALGYLWSFAGPLAWISLIFFSFRFFGRIPPIHADVLSFIVSGVLPYVGFRYTISSVARTNSIYSSVSAVATVSRWQVFSALALTELFTTAAVFLMLLLAVYIGFDKFSIENPALTAICFFMAWAVGFSFGLFFDVLSAFSIHVLKLVPVLLRPMFVVSGVFYTAQELPGFVLDVLEWNPLFHCIEGVRSGMFFGYHSPIFNPLLPLGFISLFLTLSYSLWFVKMGKPGLIPR